ncbi:ABC-three component system middle component 6 [Clostridium sp. BJN0001]|uniref:ABC-three component system middle component 6 n=1 Tax=Clostridium sp. BJN0001 TaxID=2930219 RepID=UPI001FD466AC|nr:ABC-three component system middle component 6 [Clostridium sp. BJN0001]
MILPSKHISLSESYIGLGAFLVKLLNKPIILDDILKKFNEEFVETKLLTEYHSIDDIILTLELLYCMGIVEINDKGEIYNVSE